MTRMSAAIEAYLFIIINLNRRKRPWPISILAANTNQISSYLRGDSCARVRGDFAEMADKREADLNDQQNRQ